MLSLVVASGIISAGMAWAIGNSQIHSSFSMRPFCFGLFEPFHSHTLVHFPKIRAQALKM
jgi:hypothetical protein